MYLIASRASRLFTRGGGAPRSNHGKKEIADTMCEADVVVFWRELNWYLVLVLIGEVHQMLIKIGSLDCPVPELVSIRLKEL